MVYILLDMKAKLSRVDFYSVVIHVIFRTGNETKETIILKMQK